MSATILPFLQSGTNLIPPTSYHQGPPARQKLTAGARLVTCETALELSKKIGVRILWRPGGGVNWLFPEMDAAEVSE